MRVLHFDPPLAKGAVLGAGALERLREGIDAVARRLEAEGDFEAFERELGAVFAEGERAVVGEQLERLDIDRPCVVIEGRRYRRVLRGAQRYTTVAGAVTVERTLFRAARGERAVAAMDLRAGVVE